MSETGSQSEIAYDDTVVAHLSKGMDIKRAIRAANQEHPEEALKPGPEHWPDLAARYDYTVTITSYITRQF